MYHKKNDGEHHLTLYTSKFCETCQNMKSIFQEIAKQNKWIFEEVDIDDLSLDINHKLMFVPVLYLDGREVSPEAILPCISEEY